MEFAAFLQRRTRPPTRAGVRTRPTYRVVTQAIYDAGARRRLTAGLRGGDAWRSVMRRRRMPSLPARRMMKLPETSTALSQRLSGTQVVALLSYLKPGALLSAS